MLSTLDLFCGGGGSSNGSRWRPHRCNLPVVAHGLCEHHYADRLRLGGTP